MNSRKELNVDSLPISHAMDATLWAKVIVLRPKKSVGKITVFPMSWSHGLYIETVKGVELISKFSL